MFKISRSRVWAGCQALQRQNSLPQYKAAGPGSAMPSFKANTLQNTGIEKLRSQSALRKRFSLWLIACLLESSSSRKFSLKNIFNLIKGRNVLNDTWSINTRIHVRSVTVQWTSCALALQSLSASATLVPCHQGDTVWIHESTAESWGHATSFNCSKSCSDPSQNTGSTNYILHLTLQEPLVSLQCHNIIPLVSY